MTGQGGPHWPTGTSGHCGQRTRQSADKGTRQYGDTAASVHCGTATLAHGDQGTRGHGNTASLKYCNAASRGSCIQYLRVAAGQEVGSGS